MLTVAVGWQVYNLTSDPLDLGIIGLTQFAPVLCLFLFSGIIVDRFDRRFVLSACEGLHAVATCLLLYYTLSAGSSVLPIFLILVLHGVARAFFQPASQAILPNIVSREQFSKAIAYSTSIHKIAQFAGPALGGLILAVSQALTYLIITCLFVAAALLPLAIRQSLKVKQTSPLSIQSLFEGITYIWNKKIVLGAISIDLMAVLFGTIVGLLPVFARDILNVGAEGLGVLRSMPAIGAVLVGFVLMKIDDLRPAGPLFFIFLLIFSAAIIVFGLSTSFWLSLVALTVYGGADMVSVYIRSSLVQLATPNEIRGRVSSVNSVSINTSNELGDFRAGLMAAGVGVVPSVLLGGGITIAVAAIWWRLFPELRSVDRMTEKL